MARTSILQAPRKFTANIETGLHKQASKRAFALEFSFSEYIARLIVADLRKQTPRAKFHSRRHLS